MTVFHDRRTATLHELTGSTSLSTSTSSLNKMGLSGGQLPARPDSPEQYPLNQTASVTNMR